MKARRVHATVMFADIEGFTALSKEIGAEQAYLIVTRCLKLLDAIARKHGGSVDKYLGDAILAVFGYPVPVENAPRAAARAALEMRRCVHDYSHQLALAPPLHARIGVNTGEVVAADLQGPVIREFHVLGDAVNVAARLKAHAPLGRIFVGPETHDATKDRYEYAVLEPLKLKGKERRVVTHELLASRQNAETEAIGPAATSFSALVGRDEERARLEQAVSRLASGTGGIAVVIGEEGSGKSRLLAELGGASGPEPVSLLWTRASAIRKDESYYPFAALIGAWAGVAPGADPAACRTRLESALHALAPDEAPRLAPGLALLLGSAGRPAERRKGSQGTSERAAIDSAIERVLARLAERRPLAIVLEDWQWADTASCDLLEQLLESLSKLPVLFVLSLSPDAAEEPRRGFQRWRDRHASRLDEIRLRPLDAQRSRELIDLVAGETPLPEETRVLILERAGGNPSRLIMGTFLAPALRSESDHAKGRERTSEAERRRATILFADITGFTAMTEKLDPEQAYPIVADCLKILDETARQHGGTVDKYLGDCVMVLFGVPDAIEDAPRAAVNAAIEMRRRLREYNREKNLPMPLEVHTGINTGLGIAGDISGPLIREFAVMGDPVELADQLTNLAPPGSIYVGPETHRFTRDVFDYRALDPLEPDSGDTLSEAYELLSTEPRLYRARIGSERQVASQLVGRDEEIALLRERLARLCAGEGGIATLVAEAGTGKSRLVAELAASEPVRTVTWLEGRSLSTGRQLSFHPFADLCRSWAGITDQDDEESSRVKLEDAVGRVLGDGSDEVLPFIAQILGVRLAAEQEERFSRIHGEALEKMVRNSVTQLLREASLKRPVVIVMDDLHWADLSSIELLESLLQLVEDHPIFFLNMTRPGFGETSGRIREFARAQDAERNLEIELEPLAPQAARQLISNLFKQGDIPHATRALIEEKARGNPFFIEEVVRSLVDEGAVVYSEGSFRATEKIHSVVIPGTVQEVIMARVDGLDLRRRRLLQVASVVGGSFHHDVLAAIAEDTVQLAADLEVLQRGEFIVPWDRLRGAEYAFKHPLIQEVIYDGLLQTTREGLHLEVAHAIEARLPEDVAGYYGMLAYHFSKGGDVKRTEEFLFRAGDEAARVAASSEALHFFREALELYLDLHGKDADPAKEALLQKNIARALFNRGQLIDAKRHFNRALECLGERIPRGQRALMLGFVRDLVSVLARLYLPEGRRAKPRASDVQSEVIELMFERGECAITADPERFVIDAMGLVRRLLRVDPRTISGSGKMFAASSGIFSYGMGAFDVSRRFLERAKPLVREDDTVAFFHYRTANLVHHIYQGDWSPEHEVEESLVQESLGYGQLWDVITYLANHGDEKIAMGQFPTARAEIELAAKIRDEYENDLARSTHGYLSTLLALEERRLEDALQEADVYFEENAEELLHVHALSGKAKAQTLLGDLPGATETMARCSRIVKKMGARRIPPFQLSNYHRSQLLLEVAELQAARETGDGPRLRTLKRRARRSGSTALRLADKCAMRKTEVLRLIGRSHWLAGETKDAWRWWRRSLDEGQRLGARPETARACLEVARSLVESGSPDTRFEGKDAADYLDQARTSFEELGLLWDLHQLEQVERAAS